MIDQIKQVPNYQSLTPQEIRSYLDETIEVVNMRGWTPKDILDEGRLTKDEMRVLISTMKADPLAEVALTWLSTSKEGLEFASDSRREDIDALSAGGQWESLIPGMTARVKALGRSTMKRHQQLGLAELPTVEEIEDALNPEFDTESKEVLFTLNRQGDGQTTTFLRVTPGKLRNGVVVDRGESQNVFSGDLIDQIKALIEQSL